MPPWPGDRTLPPPVAVPRLARLMANRTKPILRTLDFPPLHLQVVHLGPGRNGTSDDVDEALDKLQLVPMTLEQREDSIDEALSPKTLRGRGSIWGFGSWGR